MKELSRSGSTQAVVLVKALPQVSDLYGETVCVAAIDAYGTWLRLYPVTFRSLEDAQKFGRWDRISFSWRLPEAAKDRRSESRRVDTNSIVIEGALKPTERERFLGRALVTSTKQEYDQGRSLALLKGSDFEFGWKPRDAAAIEKIKADYQRVLAAPDMFGGRQVVPREPAPFEFFYRYRDDDGRHQARCHDWEIEATFLKRRHDMGERAALDWMNDKFGCEYPKAGMVLAMGTHSQRNWQWMIVGVVRLNPILQPTLF